MQKRKLDTVTLLGVDCADIQRLLLARDICLQHFEFADVKMLTSLSAPLDQDVIPIEPLRSTEDYSRFAIRELDAYVTTPHVLIIQYDGFILNPQAWTDEFLDYDYIGAPWLVGEWARQFGFPEELMGKLVVGNGGFSLRSKKFLSVCAALAQENKITTYHPEDGVLCVRYRSLLESGGMRFAPVDLAQRFSFEGTRDDVWRGEFGFHGLRWTDISGWLKENPTIKVDMKKNTIERISA